MLHKFQILKSFRCGSVRGELIFDLENAMFLRGIELRGIILTDHVSPILID